MLPSTPFLLSVPSNPAAAVAANNTALDGFATAQATSAALSTTFGNDFIGCVLTLNGAAITGVSSPNIGAFTNRSSSINAFASTTNQVEFWYAKAPATPLSSETITAAFSTGPVFIEMVLFGVTGVKTGTNNGFDANGSLPFQSTSGAASYTTSNGNDFLLSMFRNGATSSSTAGWNRIAAASGFTLVQYKIVTLAGAYSATDPNAGSNGTLGDALVSA